VFPAPCSPAPVQAMSAPTRRAAVGRPGRAARCRRRHRRRRADRAAGAARPAAWPAGRRRAGRRAPRQRRAARRAPGHRPAPALPGRERGRLERAAVPRRGPSSSCAAGSCPPRPTGCPTRRRRTASPPASTTTASPHPAGTPSTSPAPVRPSSSTAAGRTRRRHSPTRWSSRSSSTPRGSARASRPATSGRPPSRRPSCGGPARTRCSSTSAWTSWRSCARPGDCPGTRSPVSPACSPAARPPPRRRHRRQQRQGRRPRAAQGGPRLTTPAPTSLPSSRRPAAATPNVLPQPTSAPTPTTRYGCCAGAGCAPGRPRGCRRPARRRWRGAARLDALDDDTGADLAAPALEPPDECRGRGLRAAARRATGRTGGRRPARRRRTSRPGYAGRPRNGWRTRRPARGSAPTAALEPVARDRLVRPRPPAGLVGRFQHDHAVAGAGEIARGDEAVVATADDQDRG